MEEAQLEEVEGVEGVVEVVQLGEVGTESASLTTDEFWWGGVVDGILDELGGLAWEVGMGKDSKGAS